MHPSNKLFGPWCEGNGFDLAPVDRSDCMWMAENWSAVLGCPNTLSHPNSVRQWHREHAQTASLPEDLQALEVIKEESIALDQRAAERIAKVINRASGGGEGSDIAKRHVEALAKRQPTLLLCVFPLHGPNGLLQAAIRSSSNYALNMRST